MSNISKRRREGSRTKIKSMGDHKEFLKRISKTLYYGQLPSLPCLSLPATEISCEVWSEWQRGRSVKRLHADAAAGISRHACVSPAALVLALLYMERLRNRSPDYLSTTAPADLFLITLMVGNKFLQDDGEDEEVILSEWAASGGLHLHQLKRLELQFLSAIDWNVFVNEQSFEDGLQWLERRVALKQARLRGFFTYTDLSAATASGLRLRTELMAAAEAGALAALAYLASLLALVASALLVAACIPARAPPPHATTPVELGTHIASQDVLSSSPPLPTTGFIPNSTDPSMELPFLHASSNERLACCSKWARYREGSAPKRRWLDDAMLAEWRWPERALLGWVWRSPLVSPLQRWLERVAEYAAPGGGGRGPRRWGAVAVSDR